MALIEFGCPDELMNFINSNEVCLVTFSATWCGPCRASRLQLEAVAKDAPIPFGYVYESDLEDFLNIFVEIKAFPTYVCFKGGEEVQRVEGVNFQGIQKMLSAHAASSSMPKTGGNS
jgi:thiol-disulfide isomerase/thioredoxin